MIENYCPTTCDADATHKCFFDSSGCSVNATAPQREALGCGAGGFSSCRYCGFDDYPRCPSAEQPLLQAEAFTAVQAQVQLPADTDSETLVQVSSASFFCIQSHDTNATPAPSLSPQHSFHLAPRALPLRVPSLPAQPSHPPHSSRAWCTRVSTCSPPRTRVSSRRPTSRSSRPR